MEIFGLKFPVVKPGADLVSLIVRNSSKIGGLKNRDIVVISSKVVAICENRIARLADIRPSKRAMNLARVSGQDPRFVEIVLREADKVLGVTRGAVLTIKNGLLCANAGVDSSNMPPGWVALMPENPERAARRIRMEIKKRVKADVGVVISDSNVKPLRVGTVGQSIGVAGVVPVIDCRGDPDLYGKPLKQTFRAIADQLATAAQLIMGEGAEQTPVVIIRGLNLPKRGEASPRIPIERDLYSRILKVK